MYKGQSAACLFPHSNSHLPSHLLARRHGTRWGGMPGVSPASTPQAQMVPKTQQAYSSLQPYTLCPNHNTPQIQSGPIYFYKPTNRVGLKSKYSWLLAQLYEQLFTPQTVHEVALTGAWDAWGHGACGVCSQAAGAQAQITYLSSAPKFIPDSWDWQCCCCPKRTRDRQTCQVNLGAFQQSRHSAKGLNMLSLLRQQTFQGCSRHPEGSLIFPAAPHAAARKH